MISTQDLRDALASCGIPYDEPDFAPGQPPDAPYACLKVERCYDGGDLDVGYVRCEATVEVYAAKRSVARAAVSDALARAGAHHWAHEAAYDYSTKLWRTEIELDDYFEKWSDEQ